MTIKLTYLFLFSIVILGVKTNVVNTNYANPIAQEDSITEKSVFIDLEEKLEEYHFDLGKDKITIRSLSLREKDSLIYFSDTIENSITHFSANNIIYKIEVSKNGKDWFSTELNKKKNLSEFYKKEYEYLNKSDVCEFKNYCEENEVFTFDISAGYGENHLIFNSKGKILNIGKGKFIKKNKNFIASRDEIYNIKTDSTLNLKDFYSRKFRGELEGLESYFELISDSTLMLTYFYESYFEIDINSNLLILNSDFNILKRNSITKCPDDSYDYKVFGSFLAIFNPKFERIKLYAGKENKFYSLISNCKCEHTESGNVLKENKEQNEINKKTISAKRKEFKQTVDFISHCPLQTTFTYQIDTINKKIVTCQIDEHRY